MATVHSNSTAHVIINAVAIFAILLSMAACTCAAPVFPRETSSTSTTTDVRTDILQLLVNAYTHVGKDQQSDPMEFNNSDYGALVSRVCDLVAYSGMAEALLATNHTAHDDNLTRLLSDYRQRFNTIANNTCNWARTELAGVTVDNSTFGSCSAESMYYQCFSMKILTAQNTLIYSAITAAQSVSNLL